MSGAWFPQDMMITTDALELRFHQTRESCFGLHVLKVLFGKMSLRRGFNLAILPSYPDWCCGDCCPSGSFSHFHARTLDHIQSDHQGLGLLSYRDSPGCSKLLPFKNYGDHVALGDLQCSTIDFSVAFPRSVPQHNLSLSFAGSFDLMVLFLLWWALSSVRP